MTLHPLAPVDIVLSLGGAASSHLGVHIVLVSLDTAQEILINGIRLETTDVYYTVIILEI